jgi:hypothetical protein
LTRRIGSPSANGLVFECGLNTHAAIKFVQPGPAADNELDVAVLLSQQVQQGTRSTKEAYIRHELVVAQKDAKVLRPGQMNRLQKGQSVLTLEELSQGLPADVVQQIVQCPSFAVDALISEIACSDVNYLIQQSISDAALADIVQQVDVGCASQPW